MICQYELEVTLYAKPIFNVSIELVFFFLNLENCGEDYGIMILPDHPTPIAVRTHTREPVPYIIYSSRNKNRGIDSYSEASCADGLYIPDGWKLMEYFIDICK